ncbi:MAG: HlyD family efflux transporter periplasmic adaptor subunit [Clostridia bacterium]|nr:HlyD family efflux transporter periplasmic adaptor subunit [Clostridia bacterium]
MQVISRKMVKKASPRTQAVFLLALLFITVVAFLAWWGIGLVKNAVLTGLVNTINIQQGILEGKTPVEGFIFRNETPVITPVGGIVEFLVPDGERVRVGKPVAEITVPALDNVAGSKVVTVRAPLAGVVSYRIDGLEEIYNPENMAKLPLEKVTGRYQPQDLEDDKGETKVERGQVIFKLINNHKPGYIYLRVPKAENKDDILAEGNEINLYLNVKDKSRTPFLVKNIVYDKDYLRMIVGINNLPMELYQSRKIKAQLVTGRYPGYLIPQQALVKKKGQPGIYLVYKGAVVWEPVEIKGEVNQDLAIQADLKKLPAKTPSRLAPNAIVVINPGYVEEGQRVD